MNSSTAQIGEKLNLKRGPWTVDEDLLLMNYITSHGEGRWNSLARSAGLKRTGKSCRLRWLNYLRPDVRRGNITLEEQLTILQLHSQWGNRWSKIAQHLPGRTDNEIKNYWRTRVQKHAKQLRCDVNSKLFRDTMRYQWMPRLIERIHATTATTSNTSTTITTNNTTFEGQANPIHVSDYSGVAVSSDSQQSPTSEHDEAYCTPVLVDNNYSDSMISPLGYFNQSGLEFQEVDQTNMWLGNEDFWENLWNVGDMCFSN